MEENIYKNAKIVVVDDVEEVLNSTKNCLEFEDMQVQCFSNPIEGLEYLKNNKADVLLLDFFMPEMNGDEFVKNLREFNNETIVILQTGYSDKIPPLEMIDKMNIQGYLDKLKGEDELVLMTKAAIKTSFLNKQIREKDKEIIQLSYKKSITGNLISNIVNEAKDQVMQISAMNASIELDNSNYAKETQGIKNALNTINNLYDALNFEQLKEINLDILRKTIEILIKPKMLVNNVNYDIEIFDLNAKIKENVTDTIYATIRTFEIYLNKNIKNIKLYINENFEFIFETEDIITKDEIDEIKLLNKDIQCSVESNKFRFKI